MKQNYLQLLVEKYPGLAACQVDIEAAYRLLRETCKQGGKVLVCGNGGSAADAEHIVGELMKGYMLKRPIPVDVIEQLRKAFPDDAEYLAANLQGALPAISLVSHSAFVTAFANDVSADMVFAQQVYGYGKSDDALFCLSTSGYSANVVRAVQIGNTLGLATIGLTGRSGGRLKELCDVTICVPEDSTPSVQERHLPIYHTLCAMLEMEFFSV